MREELYEKFGPYLIEAIVIIMKEEINLIRAQLELPERTNEQLMTAVKNKVDSLPLYDFLKEQ